MWWPIRKRVFKIQGSRILLEIINCVLEKYYLSTSTLGLVVAKLNGVLPLSSTGQEGDTAQFCYNLEYGRLNYAQSS